MRVLTTIAKKKRTVITVILLDKLRFEKQKFRPRCLHQGRTKAGAELAMTGSADENPIHRSGSAHFFTRSLSRRRARRRWWRSRSALKSSAFPPDDPSVRLE
jgi:hypothetical protein